MNIKFNPDIEDLKTILRFFEMHLLGTEKNAGYYQKIALCKMKKVVELFFKGNKKAEQVLARAMKSTNYTIKKTAYDVILQSETLGIKLSRRTINLLRKTEEELAIKKSAP